MASGFPIAKKRKANWFDDHDWQLWAILAVAVGISLAILIPLISSLRLTLGYNDFMRDVSGSASYGREHGTTVIMFDGVRQKPNVDGVSRVIETLSDAGMGRPSDEVAESGVVISFGDGTSLSLNEVTIDGATKQGDLGVLVCFERQDGSIYAYDSDHMSYEALCATLGLPS